MITANVALQITVDSPLSGGQFKKDLIIDGKTGEIDQTERKIPAVYRGSYRDSLLKRADEVVDIVTISHNFVGLLTD